MPRVNKSKLIASAQKHVSKGNLDKALKDYQKILKADADDTSVRLKVGDLFERMGDRAQALAEYQRVAATFTSKGFYSKAIAVLKMIQTADPDLVEIHLELAELNEKMGLLSEVVHHYQLAANVYDRRGEKRQAIDILKKVSDVGLPNLERKVKVAELYYKEGFPDAAYEQFVAATSDLDEHSPELLEVVNRMCKACPDNVDLIVRLGSLHLAHGDPKRAISKLEEARAIEESPRVLELLGEAKLNQELLGEAKVLFEKSAQLYEEGGDSGKARDIASRITEISEVILDGPDALWGDRVSEDEESGEPPEKSGESPEKGDDPKEAPEDGQLEALVETTPPSPDGESETPEDPSSEDAGTQIEGASGSYEIEIGSEGAKGAAPEGDEDELSEDERLEMAYSEAEVYQKYGKTEGALRTLEKVAERFPHRPEPRVRLKEIHEADSAWARVAGECRKLSQIASLQGDEFRASRFLNEAKAALARLAGVSAPGTDTGETATEATDVPPIAAPDEAIESEAADTVEAADESGDTALNITLENEEAGISEEPSEPVHALEESKASTPADPTAAIEDMLIRSDAFSGGEDEAVVAPSIPLQALTTPGALDDLEILIDDEGANPGGAPLSAETSASPGPDGSAEEADEDEPRPEADEDEPRETAEGALTVDIEEAEFYANRGMIAEAVAIYATAREEAPDNEDIRSRHEALLAMRDVAPEETEEVELPASGLEVMEDDAAPPVGLQEEAVAEETVAEEEIPEEAILEEAAAEEEIPEEAVAEETVAEEEIPGEAILEEVAPVVPEPPDAGEESFVLEACEDDEDDEEVPASWDWGATDGRLASSEGPGLDEEPADASGAGPLAPPVGDAAAADGSGQSTFDLRAELEEDDEAQDEVGNVSDATEALSDLVGELKDQETEDGQDIDAQTRYDLGIAYKEMGLLDDAIRELTLAARDSERRIDCCAVLGICYRLQGMPEDAVRMLEECLGDGSLAAENAPGLLYEMGIAHEELGDRGKALDWYERVDKIDPDFEDVKNRISSLRRDGADETDEAAGEGLDEIDEMLEGLGDDE